MSRIFSSLLCLPVKCGPQSGVSFVFSTFVVAVVASKGVRLITHAFAIPVIAFIFYLPTFVFFDFLAIFVCRLLLWPAKNRLVAIPTALGCVLSAIALAGASSQLSFFIETGGELEWREAGSYVVSEDGLKVLLTGITPMIASGVVIAVISWFLSNILYDTVGNLVTAVAKNTLVVGVSLYSLVNRFVAAQVAPLYLWHSRWTKLSDDDLAEFVLGSEDTEDDDDDDLTLHSDHHSESGQAEDHGLLGDGAKLFTNREIRPRQILAALSWVGMFKVGVIIFFIITFAVRPRKPYNHMSVTLPISLLGIFQSGPGYCYEQKRLMGNHWPFPELIDKEFWEQPQGNYKGWAPGVNSTLAEEYRNRTPDWLPSTVPRGFFRWDPLRFKNGFLGSHGSSRQLGKMRCPGLDLPEPFYNPVNDPLKITNLDNDILEPLKEALGDGSVKIKHVFFILMESLRQDLFPIRHDSDLVRDILEANPPNQRNVVNDRLAHLTRHLEKLSGLSGDFKITNSSTRPPDLKWNDQTREGYGGVNVMGAYTGATMSTKSFATDHCGAWAMPVEKFEEGETFSYQPCLPQIMELFNTDKDDNHTSDDFLEQKWYPALFESMTEQYDRQDWFDEKIGFKLRVTKQELIADWRYNITAPLYQKVNYFSFAEPVLKPYIREYIGNATANNQRMFMTHFTSTTHHSWDTPDWFNDTDYLPTNGLSSWHTNFNKYLNTVRFHDSWMGELMQLIDDMGISNETLVVFAGDHGQAFKEDYYKTGTYEVPHISNFRVPISFRHPNLPRVQYAANASTISILPTILDLLLSSGSLNERDATVAADILPEYEGQSLIRPYRETRNGRRAWNFSVINSGAGMLSVTSADSPYRLVMPLDKVFEYQLSDLANDPQEKKLVKNWALDGFLEAAQMEFGVEASRWASEAVSVGWWWSLERQRLWRYHSLDGRDFF